MIFTLCAWFFSSIICKWVFFQLLQKMNRSSQTIKHIMLCVWPVCKLWSFPSVTEESYSAEGLFRASLSVKLLIREDFSCRAEKWLCWWTLLSKCLFPSMTNSCASSKCAKHKSDQLSHYPQPFVIKYWPQRLNDEAHPDVPEATTPLIAATRKLYSNQ